VNASIGKQIKLISVAQSREINNPWRLRALTGFIGILVGLIPVLGEAVVVAFLPISFTVAIVTRHARINFQAIPIFAYLLMCLLFAICHGGVRVFSTESGYYLIQLFIAGLLTFLFFSPALSRNDMVFGATIGFALSFSVMGYDYLYSYWGVKCHAQALAGNPQWAAAFTLLIGAPLVLNWVERGSHSVWIGVALGLWVLMSVAAFSGARMVFYAAMVTGVFGTAVHWITGHRKLAQKLLLTLFAGGVMIFSVDAYRDCGFGIRIVSQFEYASKVADVLFQRAELINADNRNENSENQSQDPTPSIPNEEEQDVPTITKLDDQVAQKLKEAETARLASAGASRAELWHRAWQTIQENWLFGAGRSVEIELASQTVDGLSNLIHVHNQYLSWMIWGGIPVLLAGICLISGPVITGGGIRLALVFSLPVALILIAESLLFMHFNMNCFMTIYLFVVRILRREV